MAILAAGLLQNVYASIDAYLLANLLDDDGVTLSIRLHGVRRFVPPTDDPWIESHYDFLGLQSQYMRQMGYRDGENVHSTQRRGILQLNIYQRARVFTTRYTTAAVRDLVVTAFPEGHLMQIYDYAHEVPGVEPESVGRLVFDGLTDQVLDTGMRSGLIEHLVQVNTRYLEPYTRP
jgi:hypothetical protein